MNGANNSKLFKVVIKFGTTTLNGHKKTERVHLAVIASSEADAISLGVEKTAKAYATAGFDLKSYNDVFAIEVTDGVLFL